MSKNILYFFSLFTGVLLISSSAHAAVDPEVSYILNTLLFLIGGFLVLTSLMFNALTGARHKPFQVN